MAVSTSAIDCLERLVSKKDLLFVEWVVNPFSPVGRICTSVHYLGRCTHMSWHRWFKWNNYTRPDCKCRDKTTKMDSLVPCIGVIKGGLRAGMLFG